MKAKDARSTGARASKQWQQVKAWRNQFHTIYVDIVGLHHSRRMLRRTREIYQANPALHSDHLFIAWLTKNYAEATAVGIRRQMDRRGDVVSFWRLLLDLERHATVLTRDWYVKESMRRAPANDLDWWRAGAHREFDSFAPTGGAYVSGPLIRQDRERLESIAKQASDFVNAKIAHLSIQDYNDPVTLTDLSRALDALEDLLKRYHLLLEQAGLYTAEPDLESDWESVFRVPWLPSRTLHSRPGRVCLASGELNA